MRRRALLWLVLGAVLCAAAGIPLRCSQMAGVLCQEPGPSSTGEYIYKVNGHDVYVNHVAGAYFELQCDDETRSLEVPGLPRFESAERVRNVTLRGCTPPALSYARALIALNVFVDEKLQLHALPAEPPLRADHFEGLPALAHLEIIGLNVAPHVRLPPGVFAPLLALRHLTLRHVRPGDALDPLPASLFTLKRWYTGAEQVVPSGAPNLVSLSVRETNPVQFDASGAPALQSLTLSSSNSTLVQRTSTGALRELHVEYWGDASPEPWTECQPLEVLHLQRGPKKQTLQLPKNWVANCSALRELSIQQVKLSPLPELLLENAMALRKLTLKECWLRELPETIFKHAPQLTELVLSSNLLKHLGRQLFSSLRSLKLLNLSGNRLTAQETLALASLTSLENLSLSYNPHLGDLCDGGTESIQTIAGSSPMKSLEQLRVLELQGTALTRVCHDWRKRMPQLSLLNLADTNITVLKYEDMTQWSVAAGARVFIGAENRTVHLEYTRDEYQLAQQEHTNPRDGGVTIELLSRVLCDCEAYWAAMVFRTDKRHAFFRAPFCVGSQHNLVNVSVERLICPRPELCADAGMRGCTCTARPDADSDGMAAMARCENASLLAVPGPLSPSFRWSLFLAHNRIQRVNVSDLPTHLAEIDLTDNALRSLDDKTTTVLLGKRVRLARNPLRCDCDALPLMRELFARRTLDFDNVTCENGERLPSLDRLVIECAPGSPVSIAVAVSLMLGLAAGALMLTALLSNSEARLRVKIVLERLGWWPPPVDDEDTTKEGGGYLYDAFVSHAHEDEAWVSELVARLEGSACGYRLCVHYRDWAPGEWIPAQIAVSVRRSRRTLAVVSRAFLQSPWARLEFREAHAQARRDVTPRLIVLLLEDPAELSLDPEMRAFIDNNTYVRWDDPWFWKKLEHAMPRRRRRRPQH